MEIDSDLQENLIIKQKAQIGEILPENRNIILNSKKGFSQPINEKNPVQADQNKEELNTYDEKDFLKSRNEIQIQKVIEESKNLSNDSPLSQPNSIKLSLKNLSFFKKRSLNSQDISDPLLATKILIKSAIPSIMSLIFIFSYDSLNIIFANKFLGSVSGGAVGIGNLYLNATSFFFGLGLLGGVETLCSQAFGASSYYMMGLYINTSRIALIGFFLFISLPFILISEYILLLISQTQEIASLSSDYIQSMIPSVFFALQFYASKSYLQSMNIFTPGMVVTFITASLHSIWLYLLVGFLNLGVKGIGYAMGLTSFLNFLILSVYIDSNNPNPQSYFPFDVNSVSIRRIYDYLKVALPSAVVFLADWLGFQMIILFSSYIDNISLNATVIFFNFLSILLAIPTGISITTTVLIGHMQAKKAVYEAKIYSIISCVSSCLIIFILSFVLQPFKYIIPEVYSYDESVKSCFTGLFTFFLYFGVFDALQITLNGILKGLGKQKSASLIALTVLYPINVPMTITFAYTMNYKLMGLWYSVLTAVIFLNFAYLIIIISLDWESNAQRTIINISNSELKMMKKCRKLLLIENRAQI
jgi:MATE family multidrug resistance protein